jgi:hypothetical protein
VRRGSHLVLVNVSGSAWTVDVTGEVVLSWAPSVVVEDGQVSVPPGTAVIVRG